VNTASFSIIERVFHAALKRDPAERQAFVAAELGGEPDLRREVETLLEAADRGSNFLETGPLDAAPPPDEPPLPMLGRRLGPYRLIRELGRGGMGVVYEAEQDMPHRRVALKVVYDAEEDAKILGHEPRILARLNHPAIASIHEANRTPDGFSYFAMELIEGTRLDEFVEQHKVPRRARLELFIQICDAIQHAHMKSVVHLDLKPSNILVRPQENTRPPAYLVKIVDFGVAAVTGSETTLTTRLGTSGGMVGTLAYMSPEQRRGDQEAIDVRSDVYALGVILFKLMTGALPYPIEKLPFPEAWRVVMEGSPRTPRSVEPSVTKDIETIIRTASAEEPGRRYQSVAELMGDVQRYLADQPIAARRPSKLYEWRKFAQRNKGLVATLSAVLLGLVGTIVGTSVGLVQARDAERHAREQAENAEFLTELVLAAIDVDEMPTTEGEADGDRPAIPVVQRRPLEKKRAEAAGLLLQGKLDEAEAIYQRLVDISKLIFPEGNWYVAQLQGEYGECLARQGKFADAEENLLASYAGLRAAVGEERDLTIEAIKRLIRLYNNWRRPLEASEWMDQLGAIYEQRARPPAARSTTE
jgi:serine/threonine protein kinase